MFSLPSSQSRVDQIKDIIDSLDYTKYYQIHHLGLKRAYFT